MEEFHQAGGVPAVMGEIRDSLELGAMTATGATMGENLAGIEADGEGHPQALEPALARRRHRHPARHARAGQRRDQALGGRPGAAAPPRPRLCLRIAAELLEHIDDDDLPVDASTVLVLKNGGPKGGPGMPEWGQLPIPTKLLRAGRDGHAAHLGRAHERHVLRRGRAAHLTRGRGGRPARGRADGRRDRAERRRAPARPARARRGARSGGSTPGRRPPRTTRAATGGCSSTTCSAPSEGCDFDFLRADGVEHADYGPMYARMGHS